MSISVLPFQNLDIGMASASQLDLLVVMTTVLIQSAPKPNEAFPPPH